MATTTERCPWCGSAISHSKFVQVQARIRDEERKKLADTERAMKAELEKAIVTRLAAERARFAREAERTRQKELAEFRQILQKDKTQALLQKEAEFAREREALQKKIHEMSRKVGRTSGYDVGEGAEVDVFEQLRGAFPTDQIVRVGRAKTSNVILHDVRYRDKSCGKILIDATPRGAWQHSFATKLRQATSEAGADHAILATTVFPAGKKELFIDSGVIVIAPPRVAVIVEVLRKTLIAMHIAKLGDAERSDKLTKLFRFMTSPAFKKRLTEAEDLVQEALDIDVQEKRAHDLTWKKRGTVLMRMKHVLRDIDTDVSAIVEGRGDDGGSVVAMRPKRVQ
jgi:hypothetical protein